MLIERDGAHLRRNSPTACARASGAVCWQARHTQSEEARGKCQISSACGAATEVMPADVEIKYMSAVTCVKRDDIRGRPTVSPSKSGE